MTEPLVGQEELQQKLDDQLWDMPVIRNWNVTKNGVSGQVFGSTSYKDGELISKEITEVDGNIVRIAGRRHVLEVPSDAAFEQAVQECVDHPLKMVESRVKS